MRRRGRLAVAAAAVLALALIGSALAANGARTAKAPIIIGWAFDGNGSMAPFDGPALAAAKLQINAINAKLTTEALTQLGVEIVVDQTDMADVAQKFLEDNGLL